MDARPGVIIPNIHIKKEKLNNHDGRRSDDDTVMCHYDGTGVLLETVSPTQISNSTLTCLCVKMNDDHTTSVSNEAKPVPATCQNVSCKNVKQSVELQNTSAKKIQKSVAESSDCSAKGIHSSIDCQFIPDMHLKKCCTRRRYRNGIPRSRELTSLLSKPFELNWRREVVFRSPGSSTTADAYYITPSGKKLRSLPQVASYLDETNETALSISSFTFHKGRISDSVNEIERYARSVKKKLQSLEKNISEEVPVLNVSSDTANCSTWTGPEIGGVNSVQACYGINPAQICLGHDQRGQWSSDSDVPTIAHGDISSRIWMLAGKAQEKVVDCDTPSQRKEHKSREHLPTGHFMDIRCHQQTDSQSFNLSIPCDGKSSSEGYSLDYNVKCDAQNCQEPYGLLIWVECGGCGRWMHNVCIGLQSDQAYPDKLIYKCFFCQIRGPKLPSGSDKFS